MALDAGGGEGGRGPRLGAGPLLTPRAARASLSPLPAPRAKLPQASSDGPLPVAGLTDLCSQGGSICH